MLNCKLKGRVLMIFKIVSFFNEKSWKPFHNYFCGNVVVGGYCVLGRGSFKTVLRVF